MNQGEYPTRITQMITAHERLLVNLDSLDSLVQACNSVSDPAVVAATRDKINKVRAFVSELLTHLHKAQTLANDYEYLILTEHLDRGDDPTVDAVFRQKLAEINDLRITIAHLLASFSPM